MKVVEVQGGGRDARVACSMRAVAQEDGADLDPDNLLAGGVGATDRRWAGWAG